MRSRAAENARKAGFDGVQLHAANGHMIDQFLRDNSNLREDAYGGSIENRTRLLGEVTDRLIDVLGAGLVSVRLSPNGNSQGVDDSDPEALFSHAAGLLNDRGIAFLELRQPGPDGTFGRTEVPKQDAAIRKAFHGPLVLNSDYGFEDGQADLASGRADAIAYGRTFLANPDLVERFRQGAALNDSEIRTWYSQGPEGYIDYPTLAEEKAAKEKADA